MTPEIAQLRQDLTAWGFKNRDAAIRLQAFTVAGNLKAADEHPDDQAAKDRLVENVAKLDEMNRTTKAA